MKVLQKSFLAMSWCILFFCLSECTKSKTQHPFKSLVISPSELGADCNLDYDVRPMLMLQTDESWENDLAITVGWWIGKDFSAEQIDAALSHLLNEKGEQSDDIPSYTILAIRFKNLSATERAMQKLAKSVHAPAKVIDRGKAVLILAPSKKASPKCTNVIWPELNQRLEKIMMNTSDY